LKRHGYLDKVIKGRLKVLREQRAFIRVSFGIVRIGLPLLLLVTCVLPGSVPIYFALPCAAAAGLVAVGHLAKKAWGRWALVAALYLFIPFIVFLGQSEGPSWFVHGWQQLYNASFVVLALCVIMTLRWTGRREGFKMTPMDFLILFIVFALSLLPGDYAKEYHLGAVAARIVTLFFAYEVLIGELRGELGPVAWSTVVALFLVAFRGIAGV
jgi:UDP-GlcNAc:undecaprenyl-phosphate GlcNAc-1-phosphate transferase